MSVQDLILIALRKADHGLKAAEIWEFVKEQGYDKTYTNFRVRLTDLVKEGKVQMAGKRKPHVYLINI